MHWTASCSVVALSIFFGIQRSLSIDKSAMSSSKYWFIMTRRRCSLSFLPLLGEARDRFSSSLGDGDTQRAAPATSFKGLDDILKYRAGECRIKTIIRFLHSIIETIQYVHKCA